MAHAAKFSVLGLEPQMSLRDSGLGAISSNSLFTAWHARWAWPARFPTSLYWLPRRQTSQSPLVTPLQLQGDSAAIHDLFHPLTVSFSSFPVCYLQFARVPYVIFDCVLLNWVVSEVFQGHSKQPRCRAKLTWACCLMLKAPFFVTYTSGPLLYFPSSSNHKKL
jgi:hypothetical protein